MAIAKNPMFHALMKHIEMQFYYVHELIEDGMKWSKIEHISSPSHSGRICFKLIFKDLALD